MNCECIPCICHILYVYTIYDVCERVAMYSVHVCVTHVRVHVCIVYMYALWCNIAHLVAS